MIDETLECLSDESGSDFQDMEISSSKIKDVLDTLKGLQKVHTSFPRNPSINNMDKDVSH